MIEEAKAIVKEFDERYERLRPFDDNWQELCLAAALRKLMEECQYDNADVFEPEHLVIDVKDLQKIIEELEK